MVVIVIGSGGVRVVVGGWGNIVRVLSVVMVRGDYTGRGYFVYIVYFFFIMFWRIISRWVKNIIVYIIVFFFDRGRRSVFIRDIVYIVLTVGVWFVVRVIF